MSPKLRLIVAAVLKKDMTCVTDIDALNHDERRAVRAAVSAADPEAPQPQSLWFDYEAQVWID